VVLNKNVVYGQAFVVGRL